MKRVYSRARRQSWAIVGMALLVPLLLAGCGSSSHSSSPSTASNSSSGSAAPNSTGAKASGSPIVIGGIGSVQLAGEVGSDKGFEARADRTNQTGGIDGRPIEFKALYDDGGSAATVLADVQQMILQDHVFAIFDAGSVSMDTAVVNYAAAHNTPIFGYDFTGATCGSAWFWPTIYGGCEAAVPKVGSTSDDVALITEMSQATHLSPAQIKFAYVSMSSPIAAASVGGADQAVVQTGAQVVYGNDALPQVPPVNYTPYAQQVLATHPNIMFPGLVYAEEIGFTQAVKAAGYTGSFYYDSGVPPDIFSTSAGSILDGTYQGSWWPTSLDNTPASNQEVTDLKANGGYSGGAFTYGDSVGYWSADQFISMLQAAAAHGSVTPSSVKTLVNSGYTYHGPQGYETSQTWPQSEQGVTSACMALQKVDYATRSLTEVVPYTCYPVIKITSLQPLKS